MHVRAIALALPLAMGIACAHTRSEESAETNRSTSDRNVSASNQQGQAGAEKPGQAASNRATSEPANAAQGTSGKEEPNSEREAMAGSGQSGASSGSASSGSPRLGRNPLFEVDNDPAKAHAEDQVVTGTIARVSRRTLVIDSDQGEQKTLTLSPQTEIQLDGQDAQRSDLQEGQDVRASFDEVNGQPIAVKVHAGQLPASTSDSPQSGDQGTGRWAPEDMHHTGEPESPPGSTSSGSAPSQGQ